jgi:copper transport protein
VQVWFSEDVAPMNSTLSVRDIYGLQFDIGGTQDSRNETKSLLVNLRPLTPGIYTVIWKTVSSVDGHDTLGTFPFTVGAASAPVSDAQLLLQVERRVRALELPAAESVLVHLLVIASFTLLAGALAFHVLVIARSSLAEFRQITDPASQRLLWVGLAASTCAITLAAVEYTALAGIGALAGRYGLVLAGRIVLLVVLAVIIRWHKAGAFWTLAPAAALLLTQSLLSHSAAEAEWLMPVLADWVHFICTAVWLGGVAVLALVVAPAGLKDRTRLKDLGAAISRFSPLAVFCVFTIGLTGLAQSASFVGNIDALLYTNYGRAIIVKVAFLLALVAFGAFHQQVISPQLQEWRLRDLAGAQAAGRRFRASILAEAAVSLGLLTTPCCG